MFTQSPLELLADKITAERQADTEVTDAQPRDPAWDAVRETSKQLHAVGRLWLRGQVRLGMQLAALKKQIGVHRGQPQKNSAESAKLLPWDKLVEQETSYSRRSCDEFIRLYEATVAKLKKAKKLDLPAIAKKDALALFQPDCTLTLTDEQWATVDNIIGTLTTGETQASLMAELNLVPKPAKMPKGTKTSADDDGPEETAGQLAFIFFGTVASPLINARTNPDYKKLLLALPLHSSSEHPISLATLEAEFRAALADIEEAKQTNAKPARGRTLEA